METVGRSATNTTPAGFSSDMSPTSRRVAGRPTSQLTTSLFEMAKGRNIRNFCALSGHCWRRQSINSAYRGRGAPVTRAAARRPRVAPECPLDSLLAMTVSVTGNRPPFSLARPRQSSRIVASTAARQRMASAPFEFRFTLTHGSRNFAHAVLGSLTVTSNFVSGCQRPILDVAVLTRAWLNVPDRPIVLKISMTMDFESF
jgi:hypothetical protein